MCEWIIKLWATVIKSIFILMFLWHVYILESVYMLCTRRCNVKRSRYLWNHVFVCIFLGYNIFLNLFLQVAIKIIDKTQLNPSSLQKVHIHYLKAGKCCFMFNNIFIQLAVVYLMSETVSTLVTIGKNQFQFRNWLTKYRL